jgi:hypothetical protein
VTIDPSQKGNNNPRTTSILKKKKKPKMQKIVDMMGIEPTAPSMQSLCSTTELHAQLKEVDFY